MGKVILNGVEYRGGVSDVEVNGSSVVNAQGVAEVTAVQDNPTFTEAQTRANIASGESFATILGKIKKFFTDLKTVAFSGKSSDLNNDAGFITSSGSCASATKATQDVDGNDINQKYVNVYNSNDIGGSSSLNANDMAKAGFCMGMVKGSTDNPTGSSKWVHIISLPWSKGYNTSWISQIAMNPSDSDGMWYRTGQGTIVGRAWKRIIDSSNIGSQSVSYATSAGSATDSTKLPLTGGTITGDLQIGSSSQSSLPTAGLKVHDVRNVSITPLFLNRAMTLLFTASGTPYGAGTWTSILHVAGWNGSEGYNSWEIAGPSHSGRDQRTVPLYVRSSNGNTWGDWRALIDSHGGTITGDVKVQGYLTAGTSIEVEDSINLKYSDSYKVTLYAATLTASRTIFFPNKGGTVAMTSDISSRRYKENIVPLSEDEAKKILDVEIVNYDYKENVVDEDERYDQKGAIAEDVVNLIPNAVTYADIDGEQLPDGINYTKFIPYLIKMVQMQQKEIEELKAMIKGE